MPDILAVLRASTGDFTAKMAEARAEMDETEKSGGSSFSKLSSISNGLLLGVGAAVVGVGIAAVDFGNKLEDSQASLQASLKASGISWNSVKSSVAASGQSAQKYGDTQAQVDQALSMGVISTQSYTKAHQELAVAVDLAAVKHISLTAAMQTLDKVYAGSNRALTQLGINLDIGSGKLNAIQTASEGVTKAQLALKNTEEGVADGSVKAAQASTALATAHQNLSNAELKLKQDQDAVSESLDALRDRLAGQAAAAANTFSGKLDAMRAEGENLAAQIGLRLIPILEDLIQDVSSVVTWFSKNKDAAIALGVAVGVVLAGAVTVFTINAVGNMITAVQRAMTTLGLMGAEAETAATEVGTAGAAAEGATAEIAGMGAAAEGSTAEMAGMGVAAEAGAGEVEGMGVAAGGAEAVMGEAGLLGVMGPLGLAVGGVAIGAALLGNVLSSKTLPPLDNFINKTEGLKTTTLPQLTEKTNDLSKAVDALSGHLNQGGVAGALANYQFRELKTQLQNLAAQGTDEVNNLSLLQSNFGITKDQALGLAAVTGTNLRAALSPDAVQRMQAQVASMGEQFDAGGVKARNLSATVVSQMSQMAAEGGAAIEGQDWSAIGASIPEGVAAGINEQANVAIAAAGNMSAAAVRAAQGAVKARSPSREAAEKVGWPISQGVAAGILEQAGVANAAAKQMATGVINAASSTPGALPSPAGLAAAGGSSVPQGGGGGGATIVLNLNGQEFARAAFPDLLTVMLQNKRYFGTLGLS